MGENNQCDSGIHRDVESCKVYALARLDFHQDVAGHKANFPWLVGGSVVHSNETALLARLHRLFTNLPRLKQPKRYNIQLTKHQDC